MAHLGFQDASKTPPRRPKTLAGQGWPASQLASQAKPTGQLTRLAGPAALGRAGQPARPGQARPASWPASRQINKVYE